MASDNGLLNQTLCGALATMLLAGALSLTAVAAVSESPPKPSLPQPQLGQTPEDVVRIVVAALASNDQPYPDAGIATTFAFASPANKVNTGPLTKFIGLLKNPVFGIMLNHVGSEFSEVVQTGNNAYQMVKLTALNGHQIVFAFRLSKQLDGEFSGMWMTDAVWPVSNLILPEQAF